MKFFSNFYLFLIHNFFALSVWYISPCKSTFTVLQTKFKLYYSEYDKKVGLSNSYRSFALFNVDIGIKHNFKKAEVMNYITGFLDKNLNKTSSLKKSINDRCKIFYSTKNNTEKTVDHEIIEEITNKNYFVNLPKKTNINHNDTLLTTTVKPFLFLNYTDLMEHHCDIDSIIYANYWNKTHSNDKMEEITDEIFIYEENNNINMNTNNDTIVNNKLNNTNNIENNNTNNNTNINTGNNTNNTININTNNNNIINNKKMISIKNNKRKNNNKTNIKRNNNNNDNNLAIRVNKIKRQIKKNNDDVTSKKSSNVNVIIEPSMIIISLPKKIFERMKTETDPYVIGLQYTRRIMNSKIPITFIKDEELRFLTTNIESNQLWMQMIPAPTEATLFQYQNSTKAGYIIELVINIILFIYTFVINWSSIKITLSDTTTTLNTIASPFTSSPTSTLNPNSQKKFSLTLKKINISRKKENKKLNIYILSFTLLSTFCFLLASLIKVRVIYKYIPFITSIIEYSGHIILTNMGYLSCYICGSLLLYNFIDAYTKNSNSIKILTIWTSFIILPCSTFAKVVFDLLNLSWCHIIKNIASYIIMFILFLQCIGITFYGKRIYNVLSKSQMQMMVLSNSHPFQPKLKFNPNQSYDNLNTNNKKELLFRNKPKYRVSILTISGCIIFIAQLISLILFSVLTESGTSFWIILSTRILLTDGCICLIVFLFKKESTQNHNSDLLSPTPTTPVSSSFLLNSSNQIITSNINNDHLNDSPSPILSPTTSIASSEEVSFLNSPSFIRHSLFKPSINNNINCNTNGISSINTLNRNIRNIRNGNSCRFPNMNINQIITSTKNKNKNKNKINDNDNDNKHTNNSNKQINIDNINNIVNNNKNNTNYNKVDDNINNTVNDNKKDKLNENNKDRISKANIDNNFDALFKEIEDSIIILNESMIEDTEENVSIIDIDIKQNNNIENKNNCKNDNDGNNFEKDNSNSINIEDNINKNNCNGNSIDNNYNENNCSSNSINNSGDEEENNKYENDNENKCLSVIDVFYDSNGTSTLNIFKMDDETDLNNGDDKKSTSSMSMNQIQHRDSNSSHTKKSSSSISSFHSNEPKKYQFEFLDVNPQKYYYVTSNPSCNQK